MAVIVRDGRFVIEEGDPQKKSTVWEPGTEPSAPYVVGTDLPKGELPPEYAVDTYTTPRLYGGSMETYEVEEESGERRVGPRKIGMWYTNANKERSPYTPGGLNKIRETLAAQFGVHPSHVSIGRGISGRNDTYDGGEHRSPLAAIVQGPNGPQAFRVVESGGEIQFEPYKWSTTDRQTVPATGNTTFKIYDLDSATLSESGEGEGIPISEIGKFDYRQLKDVDKPGRVLRSSRVMDPSKTSTVIGI